MHAQKTKEVSQKYQKERLGKLEHDKVLKQVQNLSLY